MSPEDGLIIRFALCTVSATHGQEVVSIASLSDYCLQLAHSLRIIKPTIVLVPLVHYPTP